MFDELFLISSDTLVKVYRVHILFKVAWERSDSIRSRPYPWALFEEAWQTLPSGCPFQRPTHFPSWWISFSIDIRRHLLLGIACAHCCMGMWSWAILWENQGTSLRTGASTWILSGVTELLFNLSRCSLPSDFILHEKNCFLPCFF